MARTDLNALAAFLVVARERSFTKGAASLGVSQPALSRTIRELEARLDIRLLTRTTRSVSLTDAGERLLQSIGPDVEHIAAELDALSALRERPSGTIRITAGEHSANAVLWPKLPEFVRTYPDIKVEVTIDYGLTDIVAERYDAGIRLGEHVARDMIGVRVGPDLRMIVVGSPAYFRDHGAPRTPDELTDHSCINLRLPTRGGLYTWEFARDGRALNVRVDGQLVFNSSPHILKAAIAGLGLAMVMEDVAKPHLEAGTLECVLDDWSPTFEGYHLYYPSRRQTPPAFAAFVKALRYR